jgi:Amidase
MSPVGAATGNFDPSFGTATEAVVALRDGVISSRELTQHVFTRIRKHNPKVNAFVTLLEEQAFAQARQSDEHRSRGQAAGPLHGVPILIKDTYETAGVRTTCGSRSLENYVPKQDAVVVARLKQAGAIIVGKTNVPACSRPRRLLHALARNLLRAAGREFKRTDPSPPEALAANVLLRVPEGTPVHGVKTH